MSTKVIKLSFEGLQNIVPNACQKDNEFSFIFCGKVIKMNTIFAEFISPAVSKIHIFDPTINSLCYDNDSFRNKFNYQINDKITDEIIALVKQISCGHSIEINEEQAHELRNISILLENEELLSQINEYFPNQINEHNIDFYIQNLQFYHSQSKLFDSINYPYIIDYVSSHFYLIDEKQLLQLPKSIIYSIITNKNLKLINEDQLLTFIEQVFSKEEYEENMTDSTYSEEEDDENISIANFYETVNFMELSTDKFNEFIESFQSNEMTQMLWHKLSACFYTNYIKSSKKDYNNRYFVSNCNIEFDGNEINSLKGIIHKLTEESGGNVEDKGEVKVTSSPPNGNDLVSKNVVDFDDNQNYFQSKNEQNSWIKYDFKERKVKPTYYSIKTRPDGGKGDNHPKNWVIEGSNSGEDEDWKILDSRNNVSILDDSNVIHTFEIKNHLNDDESFRFLRLRQTGPNTQNGNYYFLTLSALEYFGILYSK